MFRHVSVLLLLTQAANGFLAQPWGAYSSARLDSSSFRLLRSGFFPPVPQGGGQVVQDPTTPFQNETIYDTTDFVDAARKDVMASSQEDVAVEKEAVSSKPVVTEAVRHSASVDMSHYKSSYQGLTGPSKAGLVLALAIAAGMAYSSPELQGLNLENLDLSSLNLQSWQGSLDIPALQDLQASVQTSVQELQSSMQEVVVNTQHACQTGMVEFQSACASLWSTVQTSWDTAQREWGQATKDLSSTVGSAWTQQQTLTADWQEALSTHFDQVHSQVTDAMQSLRESTMNTEGLSQFATQIQDTVQAESIKMNDYMSNMMDETPSFAAFEDIKSSFKVPNMDEVLPKVNLPDAGTTFALEDIKASVKVPNMDEVLPKVNLATPDLSDIKSSLKVPNMQEALPQVSVSSPPPQDDLVKAFQGVTSPATQYDQLQGKLLGM